MNRFFNKSLVLVALVGAMAVFSTSQAEAALTMQLTAYSSLNVQQATTGVINDDGAGDSLPGAGALTFIGAVGNWVVNVDTGLGSPLLPDQPHLDLSYQTLAALGGIGDYLVIDFTETDAVGAAGFGLHVGGTNNGTSATYSILVNGVQTGSLGPFSAASFSASGSAGGGSSPYTLTQRIVVTRLGGGTVNASGDAEVVPEPATLSLLGLGLAGVAGLRRRRQVK